MFTAIGDRQTRYNWLITDVECYPKTPEFDDLMSNKYVWMTGEKLTAMINKEDFQWINGTLSAFPKGISTEDVLKYPLPRSCGYSGFFQNPLTMQHPLSEIEIVAWDSSLTLFFSKSREVADDFRSAFRCGKDLAEYNSELQ